MAGETGAILNARLRREPGPWTVPGSLPVLFFGDPFQASVATVGLNPSQQEYLSRAGDLLDGTSQRFATLASLGAPTRQALTDQQCAEAIEWMRGYYDPCKPAYRWFNALSHVLSGFGASYQDRTATHLDLVSRGHDPGLEWLVRK